MAVDEKRLSELKEQQFQKFAGQMKVTTEKHAVYSVMVILSDPDNPRLAIYSRDEVTTPSGSVVHGETETTNVPLSQDAPPFKKSTTRGVQTGEIGTIGDMLSSLVGFSIDAVATRKAIEQAAAEDAQKPSPGDDEVIDDILG